MTRGRRLRRRGRPPFIDRQPRPLYRILENNGYTLVKVGRGSAEVYKLVEVAQAASKPLAIYSAEELEKIADGDYFVCQLVMVQYLYIFITPQILEQPDFADLDQVSQKARQESEAAAPAGKK